MRDGRHAGCTQSIGHQFSVANQQLVRSMDITGAMP